MKKKEKSPSVAANIDVSSDEFGSVHFTWPDDYSFPNVPLTIMKERTQLSNDHLDTLENWGELPKILSIPEAANFIAAKCKQNPAAIKKVFTKALLTGELQFWGLSSSGEWIPGLVRVLQRMDGKPARKTGEDGREYLVLPFSGEKDQFHLEAMGINPRDGVALLASRGRKIPSDLRHLLPEPASRSTESTRPPSSANLDKPWQEHARAIADELDRRDDKAGTYSSIADMADRVAKEMRERTIHGPRGPLSEGTVKREALQGRRSKPLPEGWGKRGK